MLKKTIILLLGIYLVISLMYFGHKIFPIIENYIKNNIDKKDQIEKPHQKISFGNCDPFSFGHIAENEFRIFTRFDKDKEDAVINEADLQNSITNKTCDRSGTMALIFYDSQPVSVASVSNYDYSKPLAQNTENKAILYSVLTETTNLAKYPESGFVVALYNFDRTTIEKYRTKIFPLTKPDEDLINGHNDTIFFENTQKEAKKVEVEYETIKTDIDNNGQEDLIVLSYWVDKDLPSGITYTAIYVLSNITGSNLVRYDLVPIIKIRKSKFNLFQIVDLDSDGIKEIIIRKNRQGHDTFLVYKFDKNNDRYENTYSLP